MNRLSQEKSPYLQMHSENPVDWYPWGPEAFSLARAQDKPIFLSIGYSSCHWCHVIAHESFEDTQIALKLNACYISIKVDKEERPDVDAVYMDAVELATGSGGWPMTLLLTPEGEPFFATTYLPKAALLDLLSRAADLWAADHAAVITSARDFTRHMRTLAEQPITPALPTLEVTDRALRDYASSYDPRWGGFGDAPKFPCAHNLLFLLSHYARTGDSTALSIAEGTLSSMARGGIFDHIGGGFCRYSVDAGWLIPHFEKMLYDNALLLWAYAQAFQITQKPLYRIVAQRTADYVLREMTSPDGAFYCAQDADSEGKEGAYYVFTPDELMALLGDRDGEQFCQWYGIEPGGNFEGKSIPYLPAGSHFEQERPGFQKLRSRVYRYRLQRLTLNRDDKILTSWNALMIVAFCQAARALGTPAYIQTARRAESFVRTHLITGDGGLFLRWREGEKKGDGVLSDYAFYTLALVELYESTQENAYLKDAEHIASELIRRFSDADDGGFYLYSKFSEPLLTRPKDVWDAAMPSGNSCAALALLKLARHTGDTRWQEAAQAQLRFVAGAATEHPSAHGFAMLAITEAL